MNRDRGTEIRDQESGNRDQGSELTGQKPANRASAEFEATLRLIAALPAPEGLADRVQAQLQAASLHAAGLRTASATAPASAQILRWPAALRPASGWTQSAPARMAAAAAIVFAVLGGGWGVSTFVASRVPSAHPDSASAAPARMNAPGGFSTAGAMRTPQTLNRPIVAPAATAQRQAIQAANQAADQTPKPLTTKKSARHGKTAAARNAVVQPAAPATK